MEDDGTIPTLRGDPLSVYSGREVYWIRYDETSDDQMLNAKIDSAFRGVKSFPFKRILFQFWKPRAEGGRLLLECCRNPYAHSPLDRCLVKYRSRSKRYVYSINEGDKSNPNPPRIINGGLPAIAFLNHFPEVVLDLRVHQGSPLVDSSLDCDLTCCMMLPVFHNSSSQCLGVVECCMRHPGLLLPVFNELKRELQEKGLSIYHLEGSWPYKAIPGDLETAKLEIEKGLKMACESHDLTLAQVWISCTQMERVFMVKLSGYSVDAHGSNPIKVFYDKLDVILGEGIAWRTLETHMPYLCRNMSKLIDNRRGVLALLSANCSTKSCAYFVLCFRSSHTGQLDYAFEFFWPRRRNHLVLMETLLLTLTRYMPSFKYAASSGTVTRPVSICQISERLEVLKLTGTSVGVKRKFIAGQNNLNQSPQGEEEEEDDDDDLAILALYRNDPRLFFFPISSTFENLMEKLNMEFELDPAVDYKVERQVLPGQWCILDCLESCRRIMKDTGIIKLRVKAAFGEVGWQWKTNT